MNHRQLLSELNSLTNDEYRYEYLHSLIQIGLASQFRALRGALGQQEFADQLGVPQSVVSGRWENSNYDGHKVSSLINVANKLKIGLLVRFVSWPEVLQRSEDMSDAAHRVDTLDQSIANP